MGRIIETLKELWARSMMHRAMLVAPEIVLILWLAYSSIGQQSTAQYFTAKVEHGDVSQVVQATGTINPVNTVPVGSVVSGNVVAIYVDFNSKVKKGDVLAKIDPVPFETQLSQVQADYQNAVANVTNLEAQIENARANVSTMKANVAKAHAATVDMGTQLTRTKSLADQGVFSAQQRDDAQANYDSAVASEHATQAQEAQSEAQLASTIAQRDQAKAQVQMKKASVEAARLQLSYCTIVAPIDGTVINRTVNVGQPVAASLQAPNLFSIGQDLTHMLVYTNTDEADVGRISVGAQATFRVDTFPKETFYGHVAQVRMNAATIQNVVTYNTTIAFDNPDVRLFPGMTAYVSIPVAWANNVVKIPNGALRFKPDLSDSDRQKLYSKYGIADSSGASAAGRLAAAGTSQTTSLTTTPGAGTGTAGKAPSNGAAGQGNGGSGRSGGGGGGRAAGTGDAGIVWKLHSDRTLEPVQVGLGVTDFTFTAMTKGNLTTGDDLVIGQSTSKTAAAQNQNRSPVGGATSTAPGVPRRF